MPFASNLRTMTKFKTPLLILCGSLAALALVNGLLLLSSQALLDRVSPLELMLSADAGALLLVALTSIAAGGRLASNGADVSAAAVQPRSPPDGYQLSPMRTERAALTARTVASATASAAMVPSTVMPGASPLSSTRPVASAKSVSPSLMV